MIGMKKNILVVDDSALVRRIICDIINSDENFQATDFCRDGLEAYERLKVKSYDGVVLDVNMPRMDGLQLLERLQKEGIKAKVVMVSTLTTKDAEVTILAMERGAIDFVTKPSNVIEAKGEVFKKQLLSVLTAVYDYILLLYNLFHNILLFRRLYMYVMVLRRMDHYYILQLRLHLLLSLSLKLTIL